MLNPELYSPQFEDSACTLVEVNYDADLEQLVGKANISRVFSAICLSFPAITSAEGNICLYFSLKISKKIGQEAWQEIQSFRCPFGIIKLTSDSDKVKDILSSKESDATHKLMPQLELQLILDRTNGQS